MAPTGCWQINMKPVRHRRKEYEMKLARYEQRGVVNLNADEDGVDAENG